MDEQIKFYGIDILRYYWYIWQNRFSDVAWQTYVAYLIVCSCVFILIILSIVLIVNMRRRKRFKEKEKYIIDKYFEKIKSILVNLKPLENNEIISILGDDYLNDIDEPKYFLNMITNIRTKCSVVSYFPNMNSLCSILMITSYCENNLLKNRNVFKTLEFLCINQIIIMEGRLANYVNHRDKDIRSMARLCYSFCATNNPCRYMAVELEEPSQIKFMFLHYVLMWLKEHDKQLPDFDNLINTLKCRESIDFIKNEKRLLSA